MDVEVRVATSDDLKAIQRLNKQLFEEESEQYDKTVDCDWPLSEDGEDFYKERIIGENGCAFVLISNKEVIGYLVGCLSEDEFYRNIDRFAELDDMFILKQYRSKGYGKKLYDSFISWCKEKSVERIKVLVTVKNIQAIKFYINKGFQKYNVTLEMDL